MTGPQESLQLTARTTTLNGAPGADPGAPSDPGHALRRGDSLGRYVVLGCIGTGGMGVVYAAYDSDLDRKVAIKLLRQGLFKAAGGEVAKRRLLREAQALAKLSHPNVIGVYHTGFFGDQIFIAMEFVAGRNLREWIVAGPRSWVEILAVYRQAGSGLAAAHKAGLVHRDFKPSNIMLGEDGRVRVLDFGLARVLNPSAEPETTATTSAGDSRAPVTQSDTARSLALTHPGAVHGTPAYMAPEQLAGEAAGVASDQFSFCCALYEALCGELPFISEGLSKQSEMQRGEIREPPDHLPPWLRRALVRGLGRRPQARHPSMAALLEILDHDPGIRRRRLLSVALAATLMLALTAGWWWSAGRSTRLCRGAESHLIGVWDGPRKTAIRQAFLATAVSYAEPTFTRVSRSLDAYTADWVGMRTAACEATHVRGEQSMELLDLRMGCLDERLRETTAATELLAGADTVVVGEAVRIATGLRPLDVCADAQRLKAVVAPPDDAATAERAEEIRQALARANALQMGGRYAEGLELATSAAAIAEELAYPPLIAEAWLLAGFLRLLLGDYETAETALRDAWASAEAGRHAEVKIEAIRRLAWVAVVRRQGFEVGRDLLRVADGALRGLSSPGDLRSRWHHASAMVFQAAGRHREATDHAARAVAEGRALLGDDHLTVATYWSMFGSILLKQGENEAALDKLLEAERIHRHLLSDSHPQLGETNQVLGRIYLELGHFAEAEDHLQRAIDPLTQSYGHESAQVATVVHGLGWIDLQLGRYQQALEKHAQALDIRRRLDDAYEIALSLNVIGLAKARLGRHSEAETDLTEALRLVEAARGENDPMIAHQLINLGELAVRTGRFAAATSHLHRARTLNTTDSVRGQVELLLGLIDLERGTHAKARERLEQAVALIGAGSRLEWAQARFALARALSSDQLATTGRPATGQHATSQTMDRSAMRPPPKARDRAMDLALTALEGFRQLSDSGGDEAAAVEAWLAERQSADSISEGK